jgi:hypothetical protein
MRKPGKAYRVVQWATGNIGAISIRHFVDSPTFELVGVLVTNPAKIGKDAGELASVGATGIIATDDVEAIIAMDADCVHFAALDPDIDLICRLLRAGKNVVSAAGPFYPWGPAKADFAEIAAACRDGRASYHGSGIHPGFAGDLLPLTLLRLMDRVDHIHAYYTIDYLANPTNYIEYWGFGRDPEDLRANPNRWTGSSAYAQSMEMIAERLGKTISHLTETLELATATQDIVHARGVVKAGTVAAQYFAHTGWADGAPLITFHRYITVGAENITPRWDHGETGHRVRIDGDPPLELSLTGQTEADGSRRHHRPRWTAMAGINVIPAVCDAEPGVITHFELGVPHMPAGMLRPASIDRRAR